MENKKREFLKTLPFIRFRFDSQLGDKIPFYNITNLMMFEKYESWFTFGFVDNNIITISDVDMTYFTRKEKMKRLLDEMD